MTEKRECKTCRHFGVAQEYNSLARWCQFNGKVLHWNFLLHDCDNWKTKESDHETDSE